MGVFEALSGAKGLRVAGKSAQNIANFNAEVAKQEAIGIRKRAAFAQKRQAKRGVAAKSALIAKLGEGLTSPVAGDLIAEQAVETELENLLIGFEGEVRARQAESQAELDILQGRLAKQRGKSAGRAANIQFGTQLATLGFLSGFGQTGVGTPVKVQ
ncbi:hypothetical protein LCGC14_2638470 [marine sediment metagenome]|uniref:Uncharacterized protein n=1 Tax=marine sediment metagenome TaxID=412755 RepID=A0A0F9CQK9_9ZZZZ